MLRIYSINFILIYADSLDYAIYLIIASLDYNYLTLGLDYLALGG